MSRLTINSLLLAFILTVGQSHAIEEFRINASIGEHHFGRSVSISGDYLIVGAFDYVWEGMDTGSVYIFIREGEEWIEQTRLVANDAEEWDAFGVSVSMTEDCAIVGANGDDDDGHLSGSAYIFVMNGEEWTEQAKLTASDADEEDQFGKSVSICGYYATVGAYENDDDGSNSGSAYIFLRDGDEWTEQAKLTASDAGLVNRFGYSVSISGNYVIIGAPGNINNRERCGTAYIFVRNGNEWTEQDKLTASDPDRYGNFGCSVSINGDYAIVGAYCDNNEAGRRAGSAYIFVRDGEEWNEQSKLIASDAKTEDRFGLTVSISGDYAVVGTMWEDKVYVFHKNVEEWSEVAILTANDFGVFVYGHALSIDNEYAIIGAGGPGYSGSAYVYNMNEITPFDQKKGTPEDGAENDMFGHSVAHFLDMTVIGAFGDDDFGVNSGSAYIFDSGIYRFPQGKLTADDAAEGDEFGVSVSTVSENIIIGAWGDDDAGQNSGSVYIFERFDDEGYYNIFHERAKLTASDGAAEDRLGNSVFIIDNCAIIGAYGDDDDGENSGSAYIFIQEGDEWNEHAKLTSEDAAEGDRFGCSTVLNGDYAIIGAYQDDDDGENSGSAYIFMRDDGGEWSQQIKLTAGDAAEDDEFGFSVSIDGDYALIGAHNKDDDGENSGAAYIFRREGEEWSEQLKLTASDAAEGDFFGHSVSISGDYAVVGAYQNEGYRGNRSGSVYLFRNEDNEWTEYIKLNSNYAEEQELFGWSVSTHNNFIVAGAPGKDDNGENSGSVHIYYDPDNPYGVFDFDRSERTLPHNFFLSPAYPNPFNSSTNISYELLKPCRISIRVYDITGRLVTTLIESEHNPGRYTTTWNGQGMATGVYIVRMGALDSWFSREVILMK